MPAKNLEARRKANRKYKRQNREEVNAKNRTYRVANKRVYSDEQKIPRRLSARKWKKENTWKSELGQSLLSSAKWRAKKAGLEFTITRSDICIPVLCPLLCIPIFVGKGKPGPNSPTLDRIDSSEGYVSGNVWVISAKANRIKSDATAEEIMLLARNLTVLLAFRKGGGHAI